MRCAVETRFRYLDRGRRDPIVLLPGWASDYRIFGPLELDFNYLLPIDFSPFSFERSLLDALEYNGIKKVSIFGWSLGGFAAQGFALKYPALIDRLILVSMRERYEKEGLDEIRGYLQKNKKAYLYKFYSQCFYNKERLAAFKNELLKDYSEGIELEHLLSTLDYLESSAIDPDLARKIEKIKIIHGKEDRIAPLEGALKIKRDMPKAELSIIEDAGHMPFLERDISGEIR